MSTGGNGMLARNEMRDDWEVRHASLYCCKLLNKRSALAPWISFALVSNMKEIMLLQPHLPTHSICLAFFVSSRRVHLDLQTLMCLFFSFGFFLLIFYLMLALSLPRPQIKQLGTFILYLTTLSAKIELFGHISFSNL